MNYLACLTSQLWTLKNRNGKKILEKRYHFLGFYMKHLFKNMCMMCCSAKVDMDIDRGQTDIVLNLLAPCQKGHLTFQVCRFGEAWIKAITYC